jgi:ABC-type branched-subunit amino acid transport system ATPase component
MSTAAGNSAPLILVEEVHTFYGKSHILHGVSLEVGPGEVVGLLGRNGVGKSTTLKTIMGLVHPTRGTVRFSGKAVNGSPPHKLARLGIGYVPEDRRIFRALTVMENLRTGLDRHGVTEDKRRALLDKVFQFFPVLAERRGEGVAILLVEQNVPLTLEASQRIYIMEKGSVRHQCAASELDISHPLVKQYLGV